MYSTQQAVRFLALALAAAMSGQVARGDVLLGTPDWKITLTDFGYSDLLLDRTPGFEGREYLSGEWGAAVSYQVEGREPVAPTWLERDFIYPDWKTNSDFEVARSIRQVAVNDAGHPIAESVIRNADLEITQRFEVVDTMIGTPMGNMADSLGGDGMSLRSNRYVLKQTYMLKNHSGAGISGLRLFQILHTLNGQRGLYDPREYPGPLGSAHHDVTLSGMDPWSVGQYSAPEGLEDFVSFHSSVAPSAFEIGHYGIQGNGLDNHVFGKPSDGVHLSIEDDWATFPYDERKNTDWFEPENRWVSGAQRWDLADLADGEAVSMEVWLSLLTGTRVGWVGNSGGCGGGADHQRGMDFEFTNVTEPGLCFARAIKVDARELGNLVDDGVIPEPEFPALGGVTQLWEMAFTGQYEGAVNLVFAYDSSLIPPTIDSAQLCVFQSVGGTWQPLPTAVNPTLNKLSFTASSLTFYALGLSGGDSHVVSAAAMPSNGGEVFGAGTYADGVKVTLLAAPAEGFVFEKWTKGEEVLAVSPEFSFIIDGDCGIQAHFEVVGDGLAVSTRSLPTCGGQTIGGGVYETDAEVAVSALPNSGYRFDAWLANGVEVANSPDYAFSAETHVTLTAVFSRIYTITAAADPQHGGDVIYDGTYDPEQTAELTAMANPGYVFTNWTENGDLVGTNPTLYYRVTRDRTLVANFVPLIDISVESSPLPGGTCSGSGQYAQGYTVTARATPDPGYVFLAWTVNGETVSTTPEFIFPATAALNLIGIFEAVPAMAIQTPAGGPLTLAWPVTEAAWTLQESPDLVSGWEDSTRTVEMVDGMKQVVIGAASGSCFFRLRR
jgi:hypothetical protein